MATTAELVDYLGRGSSVFRPVAPNIDPTTAAVYFSIDTETLDAFLDGETWVQFASVSYVDGRFNNGGGGNLPLMDGVADPGTSNRFSRQDHIHPSDTTMYPFSNPLNFQTDVQIAALVASLLATQLPLADASASIGVSPRFALEDHIHPSLRGLPGGIASLDDAGHVPASQLPAAATGALNYVQAWNPSTNTPVMSSGALVGGVLAPKGNYFVASVAGTTAAIDGVTTWNANDWIISNGVTWERTQPLNGPFLLLTGGNLTGPVFAPSLGVGQDTWSFATAYEPGFVWSIRDSASGIALGLTTTGELVVAAVSTPTTDTMPVSRGYANATYMTTFGGTVAALAVTGALSTTGPFNFSTGSSYTQPLEPGLAWSVRDSTGNIAVAVTSDGTFLAGNLSLPPSITLIGANIGTLGYTDFTSSGASTDWLTAFTYDLTISDGTNLAGGILPDGRFKINVAQPTQNVVGGANFASAAQVEPGIINIASCPPGGGVQVTSRPGGVWYIANTTAIAVAVWPSSGSQFGVLAPNSPITLDPSATVVIWYGTQSRYGVMQAGAGGGGAGFVFTGTGFSNPRDMRDRVADTVNVNDLVAGIDPTGVADNSTQIKQAHDLAFTLGYRYLRFPARSKIHAPFGGAVAAPLIANVIFTGEKCSIDSYRKVIVDPDAKPYEYPIDDLTPPMVARFTTAVNAATPLAPAKVVILGHSGVDADQRNGAGGGLTGVLQQKLSKVYSNKPIVVVDRSIGGTGWNDLARSGPPQNHYGNDAGNPVSWAQVWANANPGTGYNRRWIEYALDQQPVHAIFFCHGANDNVNFDITCMESIIAEVRSRFSPVPDIFMIADYGRQLMSTFTGDIATQEGMDYCAGYQRTWCRRNGIGFFDFGRGMAVLRDGFDPVGGRLVNFIDGFPEEHNNQLVTHTPYTFPTPTYHFSYRLGPAGNMNAVFSGGKKLITKIGNDAENILILEQDVSGKLAYTVQSINSFNALKYGRETSQTWAGTMPYYSIPRTLTNFDLTLAGGLTIDLDIRDSLLFMLLTSKSGTTFTQDVVQVKVQIDRYGGLFQPSIYWDTGASTTITILQAANYVPDQYMPQMTDGEFLDYTLHINPYGMSRLWVPIINAARFV